MPLNCAPALTQSGATLYVAVSNGGNSAGLLVAVTSSNLNATARARLTDPHTKTDALILDDSSASPMVGSDGDVYYGVFESSCCSNHDRGWLMHFNSALVAKGFPGAFGWDTTPSLVPRNLIASYSGPSSYLVLTKYNNYFETGGNGMNYVAVTDPNVSMSDPVTGVNVMNVVIQQLGQTPDHSGGAPAGAVREWCINSAAIDPSSKAAIINSEDGHVYRWDFTSNSLTQKPQLANATSEAYTPTVIGPDGTVYAINDAVLFAVGQ